ncbi:MAG: lantibiotic dehydratase, partial [Acidobacteriota bacterium]
ASTRHDEVVDSATRRLPEVEHDAPCLLQVDLYKPAAVTLGRSVVDQVVQGIEVLHKLSRPDPEDELDDFRRAFVERYGVGRDVPLLEALDAEIGVGLKRQRRAGLVGPWIGDLRLRDGMPAESELGSAEPWSPREDLLRRRLDRALASGAAVIDLTAAEIDRLDADPRPLPQAFSAMFTIAAESASAVDEGHYELLIHHVVGPSGARMLGRFCQGDATIRRHVEAHLRAEEAADPDALYAEVVHLPEGRLGNILNRPILRAWEIPFLGRSGAAHEHQISPRDLTVSVVDQRVQLRSRRLGRRVEPRLTSAHAFDHRTLGLYRFLCLLQGQGLQDACHWSWAPFDRAAFLPRVCMGRLVLSRARWRIEVEEQQRLGRRTGAARYRGVRRWRDDRRLPRFVVQEEGDHRLSVDLDNPLVVDHWIERCLRQERAVVLTEMFPPPDRLAVDSAEGRFVHEIILPMERRVAKPSTASPPAQSTGPRRFAPGSEWLYLKLYAAPSSADALLRSLVAPIRRRALDSGAADQWHVLRYADPDWHLRLRFHGRSERLLGEVVPWIEAAAAPFLRDGRLRRWQLDTYDRELERYGGDAAISLIERCFFADSEWALAVVETHFGESADDRWRLALAGVHRWFLDFGVAAPRRLEMVEAMRDAQWSRFGGADATSRKLLGRKLRPERATIEALITGRGPVDDAVDLGALDRRSEALAPSIADL